MPEFQKIIDTKQDLKKSGAAILLIEDKKSGKFAGFKVSPSRPTDDQLKKINQFTRREFKADELYIGQMRLAHNAVDRDVERFSEEVVQRFVNSAIRKTMLLDHDRSVKNGAAGKFFDVELEKMPLQQAIAETGENLQLPAGITEVWFVSPWFFIPLEGIDPKEIVKIDAGIYDWASIGFRAESLMPIRSTEKGKEDVILYWEYRGSSDQTEMTEGSLVYLGAQPGASVKSAGAGGGSHEEDESKGAVAYSATTAADEGRAWDGNAAKRNLARWASSDGSGDKDKIDWAKYRKGFAWYDPANAQNFEAYKLPHHDVIDGQLSAVWNGVSSAMAVCMGSMGGVDIPEDQLPAVIGHLAKHYKQFGKEPPAKVLHTTQTTGGTVMEMKELLERLKIFFGRNFTEANVYDEIKAAHEEKVNLAVDGAKKPLTEEIKKLTPLAQDGNAYRASLMNEYVAQKVKLGEVSEKPENQEALKGVIANYPIDFLKSEISLLKTRVYEKFPAESQLSGGDVDRGNGKGKKNPLIPEPEKTA